MTTLDYTVELTKINAKVDYIDKMLNMMEPMDDTDHLAVILRADKKTLLKQFNKLYEEQHPNEI